MYRIKKFYICSFLLLFYTAAGAQTITVGQYIDSFKDIALREMIEFKIPASITLAQGLLESGSGNSRLAKQGNNHFGIKCKKEWTGCSILEDDDDLQECFRCYTNAEESYKDHSKFLRDNKRYAELFTYQISDYKAWASGLLAAGYATNKKYSELLIGCIERNHLAQFDTLVMNGYNQYSQKMPANIDIVNPNNIPVTVVQVNQTTGNVASANGMSEKRLIKNNDLNFHTISPGDVLYLKPKKRKASVSSHTVNAGENMWTISQKYAIKLNSLYKKNLMEPGTEPVPGSVLQLQHKATSMPDTGRVEELNPAIPNADVYHVVSSGETLYGICKKYGMTLEELKSKNNLSSEQIAAGQRLKVKGSSETPKISTPSKSNKVMYVVKSGDTLYSIAKSYSVTVDDIKKWNELSSESLKIGQNLIILK